MIRNHRTERVHRALAGYIRPKLRKGVSFDATPAFVGIDDSNLMDHISHIAAAAMRLTANQLAFDANPHELHKKMREAAVKNDDGTEIDEDIVNKVLALLEMRLTPTELQAVKQILVTPSKGKSAFNPGDVEAEDSRLAFDAFAKRFPNAAKIRVEPTMKPAPAPQQATPANPSSYFERFPDARRIGIA